MCALAHTVELYQGPILRRWVLENPALAEDMLVALRFAAFGLPDAARLVREMEEMLGIEESAGLARLMIESAVRELGSDEMDVKVE